MRPALPADQTHPALGQAWYPPFSAEGSASVPGMDLRRDLPRRRKGAGIVMPRCNSEAMSMHLEERRRSHGIKRLFARSSNCFVLHHLISGGSCGQPGQHEALTGLPRNRLVESCRKPDQPQRTIQVEIYHTVEGIAVWLVGAVNITGTEP
jgi:hypothetical protein